MKILLDIKDEKAHHFLEVLSGLPYFRTRTITPHKAKILEDLSEAVEEMKMIKAGKLTARNAEDLFNEL